MTQIIIPVDIRFDYDSNENGYFTIDETKLKEKDLFNDDKRTKYEKTNKLKLCLTIENFPKKFPNLVKYQEMQDADIFEIQNKLHFPEQIQKFWRNIFFDELKMVNCEVNEAIVHWLTIYVSRETYLFANISFL